MQQNSNGSSQPQWRELAGNINGEKPTTGDHKLLISQDHLILLTYEGSVVYTFHLKNFSWTKHNVNRKSTIPMSFNSCLAKPGLIVDLNLKANSSSLELLTFETGKVPTNFCQTSRNLKNSLLNKIESFAIGADPTSIYLFGGKETKQYNTTCLNTLYQVDIESCQVAALSIDGPIPCERNQHLATLYQDRLFIFGGKEKNGSFLSDLWAFNLSEKKWKRLDNPYGSGPKDPSCLFAQDDQLLICKPEADGIYSTWSYNFNESSWKIISSSSPKFSKKAFGVYENSLMALFWENECVVSGNLLMDLFWEKEHIDYENSLVTLESSALYSLNISNKIKRCSEKQPENFMTKMFQDKTFADVIFQVGDQEFPANKCFLSVRCPYFKNVFTSNMMESQSKMIRVPDERAEVFKVMLEYLYFIEIEVGCEIAEDLFKLSHKYRLENLKNDCEELLTKDIRIDNVIKKVHFAKLYEASSLRKACLIFIVKNLDEVFLTQDIHELDKETLLELHKIKI